MKKIFLALPLVFVLASCGSAGAAETVVPDIPFGADAKITYDGVDISAHVTRSESGEWEFRISAPYALEGVVMTVSGADTTVTSHGLESVSDKVSGTVSMAKAIAALYDEAAGAKVNVSGEGYTLSGMTELGSYTLNLDADRCPVLLFADIGSLRAEITGFEQITPPEHEAQILE